MEHMAQFEQQTHQPSTVFTHGIGLLQRKCACGGSPGIDDMCEECRGQKLSLQRSALNLAESPQFSPSRQNVPSPSSQARVHVVPGSIQTKLSVSQPGDRYEQEAEQVAEQVIRMPAWETAQDAGSVDNPSPIQIQRLSPQDEEVHRQPDEEEEETLQAKESPGHTPTVTPELHTHIRSLQGGGQPLPEATRVFMEPRFGHDFSKVRIHTDERAAETARAVNALAYTVGRNVMFGAGQYDPGTTKGKRLLAHELTHVIQQQNSIGNSLKENARLDPLDLSEYEAEHIAHTIVQGRPISNKIMNTTRFPYISYGFRTPILQRVSFGNDGVLPSKYRRTIKAAAQIAEQRVKSSDFRKKWEVFWKDTRNRNIAPKPSLEQYQAAVAGLIVHDMETSTNPEIRKSLQVEKSMPLLLQTAAITPVVGSKQAYIRRFAIDQGIDSVVNLILHESLHAAGLPMGKTSIEEFEIPFHVFEREVGFPLMVGGAAILDIRQVRKGPTAVGVTVTYNLSKFGIENISKYLEIQVVDAQTGEVVYSEQENGLRTPARQKIPAKVGRGTWLWHARDPGWNSYSVRIINLETSTLLASRQFKTNPRRAAPSKREQTKEK